jgi:hypothetical protein
MTQSTTFGYQVHRAIGAAELEHDSRIAAKEIRQRRCDDVASRRGRNIDAQPSRRRGDRASQHAFELGQLLQQGNRALVIERAVIGQAEPACRAMEKPHAEMRFQLLDDRGHPRLGKLQRRGRAREAAEIDDAGEYLHGSDAVDAHRDPFVIDLMNSQFIITRFIPLLCANRLGSLTLSPSKAPPTHRWPSRG